MRRAAIAIAAVVVALLLVLPLAGTRASTQILGYTIQTVTLPSFASLSSYVYNDHGSAYPAYDFAGKYAGDLIYIDSSSRMDWYSPSNGSAGSISGPLSLLYQTTTGLEDQIDNEFMLDTPYDVALLYGNATTSPGHVTVETVNLSTGAIHSAVSPSLMENAIQADYIGGGVVVVFNATSLGGEPTYFTNVLNGTSWYSGLNIGIAPGNIYWVWQLDSFIDVQGTVFTQYRVSNDQLVQVARVWANNSAVSSISAANGVQYNGQQLAFWLSTNAGWYDVVLSAPSSDLTIQRAGSYAYFGGYVPYIEHYDYTSTYVWAVQNSGPGLTGPSVLLDMFTNSTLTAPNVLGRQAGSGGWSNYLFENPMSTSEILSLNASLAVNGTLGPNQFVYAAQPPPPVTGGGAGPGSATGWPTAAAGVLSTLASEWYTWAFVLGIVLILAAVNRSRRAE